MQTSSPMNNTKIAIVGMNARFGAYSTLDAFERSIYEGLSYNADRTETQTTIEQFDRLAEVALEDASITSDTNIAVVVANRQQKLTSIATQVDSVFDGLVMAQKLLCEGVEAVLLGGVGVDLGSAMGAVVLMPYETAKRGRHKVYAVIDRLSLSSTVEPQDVAYLELLDDKPLEEVEIEEGIHNNYFTTNRACSCAVSSVTNAGYRGIAAEIASLIKTALCLYYRYIPPVPGWQQTTEKQSSFYVMPFAKPWFLEAGVERRIAAIDMVGNNAHIILAEAIEAQPRSHRYLEQTPYYLFPLAAGDMTTLLEQLNTLQQTITASSNLDRAAKQTFAKYRHSEADYALAIVGKDRSGILKECDRATQGIAKAFKTGKDWHTPVGSYFTPKPQGKKGKVAYVYPGAYNAHVGLGKDLFRLFPNLIDDPVIQSTCNRIAGIEKLLYPRSWHQLSPREREAKERELMNDPLAMLESETGFAGFITTILRDYFQVKPEAAFGYSLGETSMMYAQGIWGNIDRSSDILNTSALFKTRLSGTKETVREYWQLPDTQQGELWRTYVVMANSELVREKLKQPRQSLFAGDQQDRAGSQSRVYLTQISTPNEVIIAGDPQGCEEVIDSLGCDAFRAPFNHVIHCPAMKSEYDELIELNTLPLRITPEIAFYSAANYQQISCSSEEIAHSLTQTLCQQLDFPRLVERVYQDDYRVFIEVGVGSNCSRWIKDILQSEEHAVVSLHRRGSDDFTSLIKAIAKLWSHRVQLDLSVLYGDRDWGSQETRRASSVPESIVRDSKTVLSSDRDNLILWQPTYLNSITDSSLRNNQQLSKAHSIFIRQDWEFSLNNQNAITNHLQALEELIDKSS